MYFDLEDSLLNLQKISKSYFKNLQKFLKCYVFKSTSQYTISAMPKYEFPCNTLLFLSYNLLIMSWIETKLCRDDKDLAFYKILWLILCKNDLSYFELQFFVTYKIKIQNTLKMAKKFKGKPL